MQSASGLPPAPYDLLVIGGGINGAGIARDAAGRGLAVLLVEQGDLAGATSSASSKLIHGGLRYLEHYEFRLVREALGEREVLLRNAPHIIWPLTFVLPHDSSQRPRWMIRAGLFLYDHLAARKSLPGSRSIDLTKAPEGKALNSSFKAGFTYADCWVEDSRLVVLNAMDAAARSATIRTRCRFVSGYREQSLWRATLEQDGQRETVSARAIVNAAGPWVQQTIASLGRNERPHLRLIKGSHIVVPRLYEGNHAYILQNADGRVVFVIPYEGQFSLIGTTDVAFTGDPSEVAITPVETAYLCGAVARVFAKPPKPEDVVWSYAGVRPLYDDDSDDPSAVTRDYVLELDGGAGAAPVLSVFGGKITTFRRLAEHAMEKLQPVIGFTKGAWTGTAPLPGGDVGTAGFEAYAHAFAAEFGWLPPALARRLVRAYGTRARTVLGDARSMPDMGTDLGAGLTVSEVRYLITHEWAVTADDILWRRSKLGLHGGAALKTRLDEWFAVHQSAIA